MKKFYTLGSSKCFFYFQLIFNDFYSIVNYICKKYYVPEANLKFYQHAFTIYF